MNKAEQFVNNFRKAFDELESRIPEWMSFWIFVYARDCNDRTNEEPDWKIQTTQFVKWNHFDISYMREIIIDWTTYKY